MLKKRSKLFAFFAFFVAMAIFVTGCGAQAANEGGPTGEGRGDGILVVGTPEPQTGTFSPLFFSSAYDAWTVNLVHQSLYHWDEDFNTINVLAAGPYEISEDGLTYTIPLREGVYFSDGAPFTAEDVALTLNALADESYVGRYVAFAQYIEGFDAVRAGDADSLSGVIINDPHSISVTFTEVRRDNVTVFYAQTIISATQFADFTPGDTSIFEAANGSPVGTGPFMLQSWDETTGSVHVRNPYFWDGFAENAAETIVIRPINNQMVVEELQAGNIDLWPDEIMGHNIDRLIEDPMFNHVDYLRGGFGYMTFNTVTGATEDVAVRQALMYSFDRDSANAVLFETNIVEEGIAYTPATVQNPLSPMGPVMTGEVTVDGLNTYEYNPERAIEILEEAGWHVGADGIRERDGERLVIRILAMPDHSILDTLVPIWDTSWTALGVDVQVATIDFNALLDIIFNQANLDQWNVFFLATSATDNGLGLPRSFVHSSEIGDGLNNFSRINDPEIDRLLDEGTRALDDAEALAIYKELAVRINELVPMMPIYANQLFDFYNVNQVGNYTGITALRDWPRIANTITVH